MEKYGIITNKKLIVSDIQHDGYKPVAYADIPEFDQCTQGVFQTEPVDKGEWIEMGVEVRAVVQDEIKEPGEIV